jgi:putative endonuclease
MINLRKIFGICAGFTKLPRLFLKDTYYVYIVTNYKKTLFQVGITSSLNNQRERWCRLYDKTWDLSGSNDLCIYIVYYERFSDIAKARFRKQELETWYLQRVRDLVANQKASSADQNQLDPHFRFSFRKLFKM